MSKILVRGASQVVTARAPFVVIERGAVLIEDGIIREVGLSRRLENLHTVRDAEELGVKSAVVMPGFVDLVHVENAGGADEIERLVRGAMRHGSTTLASLAPAERKLRRAAQALGMVMLDSPCEPAIATFARPGEEHAYSMQMVVADAAGRRPVEEAILAATIGNANASGNAKDRGSIEAGKRGDLLVLFISDYRELAHNRGVNLLHMTIREGKIVCRND